MSTEAGTIEHLKDCVPHLPLRTKSMFGEYALYLDDKVLGFICDDILYLKPTEAGRALIGTPVEGHAYPGSKIYWALPPDRWEDGEWLRQVLTATAAELPVPKPKKTKKR